MNERKHYETDTRQWIIDVIMIYMKKLRSLSFKWIDMKLKVHRVYVLPYSDLRKHRCIFVTLPRLV